MLDFKQLMEALDDHIQEEGATEDTELVFQLRGTALAFLDTEYDPDEEIITIFLDKPTDK